MMHQEWRSKWSGLQADWEHLISILTKWGREYLPYEANTPD
jgi:hypothetical protein